MNEAIGSPETEQIVLGAILLAGEDRSVFDQADQILTPDDFLLDSNRLIFRAMKELAAEKFPIHLTTVFTKLKEHGKIDDVGGPGYISELTTGVPRFTRIERFCRSVKDKAHTRRVAHLSALIQQRAMAGEDLKSLLANLQDELGAIGAVPSTTPLLIPAPEFLGSHISEIDWLVEGVIQRGANGFIVAAPKVGKSWCAADLAIAVACGAPWLGIQTYRAPVALISREDNPRLTQWRMNRLLAGRERYAGQLEGWLWINSKDQSPQFRLDNRLELAEMIHALKQVKPELVILDVLNVLHSADENDGTEMRKVMDSADAIHRELKCSVCILHHFNKANEGRLTGRMRGSSAIAGWAEWVIGLKYISDRDDEKVRSMQFELKAGEPQDPIHFTIETMAGFSRIAVVEAPVRQQSRAEALLR